MLREVSQQRSRGHGTEVTFGGNGGEGPGEGGYYLPPGVFTTEATCYPVVFPKENGPRPLFFGGGGILKTLWFHFKKTRLLRPLFRGGFFGRGRWTSHKYMWKWMGLWCFLNGFLGQGEDLQSLNKHVLILKSFNGQMVWG